VHKRVLFFGVLISLLYVFGIVYFNKPKVTGDEFKFLYILNDKNLTIITKFPDSKVAREFTESLEKECLTLECKKDISFGVKVGHEQELKLLKKLVDFSKDNSVKSASLVAKDDDIELNFLLKSYEEVKSLRDLYKDFDTLNINDKSSVLKVFDVENIQKDIDSIIKKNSEVFDEIKLDLKTIRVLNKIFRKVKVLGRVEAQLFVNSSDNQDKLRSYILTHYSWVKNIDIKKSDKNKIIIKEVLQ